jgi:hypothetical protein
MINTRSRLGGTMIYWQNPLFAADRTYTCPQGQVLLQPHKRHKILEEKRFFKENRE